MGSYTSQNAQSAASAGISRSERRTIYSYLAALLLLMALCDPNAGLMDIPIGFFLKNTIHLDATQVSQFRFLAAVPLYLSFLFGLVRDNWSPFGRGDRGYLAVFGALTAVTYAVFAFVPATTASLLAAILLLTMWSLFIVGAQSGLACTIGQQHAITGPLSVVMNIFIALPAILASLAGGQISRWLDGMDANTATRHLFLLGALIAAALSFFGTLRPGAVYDNVRREHASRPDPFGDLKRLMLHRPARRALLIWTLWNFAPGSATPLQFYLQDELGGTAIQWGQWNAIFIASFIPTYLLYGFLCPRVSSERLMVWGTLVAIPQYVPLLVIHSLSHALLTAVPIGLMGGLATAAFVDLTMRSAPKGLQGTMMMSAGAVYFIATRLSDVLGSFLLDFSGSFAACVALSAASYAAILLPIRRTASDFDK